MYFPEDYRWSHGMMLAIGGAPWGGGEMDEAHRVGLRLRGHIGDDTVWFREWVRMAERVEKLGRERAASGHDRSAAAHLFRAAHYYHAGERFLHPKTAQGLDAYRRGVECFKEAAKRTRRPRIEHVEVPYEGTNLPAILVHAEAVGGAGRRVPAMVYFDGFDITKEIQYFKGMPDLAARGIACLIVDGPGQGEAIRFRNMPLRHDFEVAGSAALDYLETRPDVDMNRVGIVAMSLGGYYAPRCAAMDKRYKACIAWGAVWDYHATWKRRLKRLKQAALPVPVDHLLWACGVDNYDDALKKLEGFRLDGVAQKMECPFLLTHGTEDAQVPMEDAQKLFDAIGSKDKTFRIFTPEEGGAQHCQRDYLTRVCDVVADWLEDKLGANTTR